MLTHLGFEHAIRSNGAYGSEGSPGRNVLSPGEGGAARGGEDDPVLLAGGARQTPHQDPAGALPDQADEGGSRERYIITV